jgi:hypothetical protein
MSFCKRYGLLIFQIAQSIHLVFLDSIVWQSSPLSLPLKEGRSSPTS